MHVADAPTTKKYILVDETGEVANACGALAAATEGSDASLSWDRIETMADR